MDHFGAIDEMSGSELLDFVGDLAVAERRVDARVLMAAVQHAVLNGAATVDPVAAGWVELTHGHAPVVRSDHEMSALPPVLRCSTPRG